MIDELLLFFSFKDLVGSVTEALARSTTETVEPSVTEATEQSLADEELEDVFYDLEE